MTLLLSGTDGLSDVDGSAATPAIRGTDANTGIFFPAADTIAFSEGGAEVMRLDSSGNLGVGTASPTSKLDVNGALTATSVNSQNTFGFKNRLINGAMVIDQRNAGASVTATSDGGYTLDRWKVGLTQSSKFTVQQNAGSVTPPVGFSNYLGVTSSSAYSVGSGDTFLFQQNIEGFNTSDLGFGTANASTITLSFWIRSSLTGTFGGSIINSGGTRSYPFSYTVSSANTWEQKSVSIAGDTSGTWVGATNAVGIGVRFGLGSGSAFSGTAGAWGAGNIVQPTGSVSVVATNGATFYITGVQLEKGSTATSFDYRPYGTELLLCQRYYYRLKSEGISFTLGTGVCVTSTITQSFTQFPTFMRSAPTALEQSGTAGDYRVKGTSIITCSAVPAISTTYTNGSLVDFTVASGLTAGQAIFNQGLNSSAYLGWSAEL
jgi:hypothetical protein